MQLTPYLEIYPSYEDGIFDPCNEKPKVPTSSYVRDGSTLYLMGATVLCKYDISEKNAPRLIAKTDVAADHTGDPLADYIRRECAHSTSIVDIGDHLVIALRGGGGGTANMADGVTVGNISVIDKKTLRKVKELNFENRVTYITRHGDLLIVSLHFHGFYIYRIVDNDDVISCIFKYVSVEAPRSPTTVEFQNSTVFEAGKNKINIAFASYIFGISVFTYDTENNTVIPCSQLHPNAFSDMQDGASGVKNTVFGLTSKGKFVYGGISPGNNRFREQYKNVDWDRFDKRGIIYGPHDSLEKEHYHLELPEGDKPEYIGVISGDPAPSFLCTVENFLLFNLDLQGLGIARIEKDNTLTYIGRMLEDSEKRALTYKINFDGEFLYASYKTTALNPSASPVFRMYKAEL